MHKRDGKDYIEIEIPAYSACISYKGVYHYRSGSTKQVLTGPALESFLNGKRGVNWDNMPNPAFKLNDIDDSAFEKFKELAAKKGRTVDNLFTKHGSRPYNPNIANVFYLAGFIESWGRGIEKICDACKLDNLPTPEFTINLGDIMVKFTAPEDRIVHGPGWVGDKVGNRVGNKVGNKVGNRGGDKVDIGKSDIKEAILELLNIDPGMTYKSMSKELSVSEKTVYKCMKQMRENNLIERIGYDKKGILEDKVIRAIIYREIMIKTCHVPIKRR